MLGLLWSAAGAEQHATPGKMSALSRQGRYQKETLLLRASPHSVASRALPEAEPSWLAPPAASVSSASGNVSYRQRSLAGAEAEVGLQNTPPPCGLLGR